MLIMSLKKNSLLEVDNGKKLIGIQGVSKKGLLIKVLNKNNDETYSYDGIHLSSKEKPLKLEEGLEIFHLKGTGNQVKVGLKGEAKVYRCPKKFKYTIYRERNLDDDFFNFNTEGY